MEVLENPKNPKFYCEFCHFKTNNKKDYSKHLTTAKHQKAQHGSILEVLENPKTPNFKCECGKQFVTHSGIWKHKKQCANDNTSQISEINTNEIVSKNDTAIIDTIVNENKTFK
jgi:hypothetical protein